MNSIKRHSLFATLVCCLSCAGAGIASASGPGKSLDGESACQANRVELQVLGSGGPEMDDRRASSAYLVWIDHRARILIDAGGGSSLNFEKAGASIEDLQAVLFTHFHVDHSAAFPVLIKAAFFTSRKSDLPVYGPTGNAWMPSTSDFVGAMLGPRGAYRYLSEYASQYEPADFHLRPYDIAPDRQRIQRFMLPDRVAISTIAVHHGPIPALAWRVDAAGCAIAFSGDMNNDYGTLAKLARHADILVAHNAIPEDATGVARNLHMPPSEIGKIAASAQPRLLVLSHRMNRTLGRESETRHLIRMHYRGPVRFANDLDRFSARKPDSANTTNNHHGDIPPVP